MSESACWVCGANGLVRVKQSNLARTPSAQDFKISSSDYGRTGAIDRCEACGFHQCSYMTDVLSHYEEMSDADYEGTREQRAIQERALLRRLLRRAPKGRRLLDVGAGSGILVEQALKMGLQAQGVEPSRALQARAVELGLPVHLGVLPHTQVDGPFDIVTIVDVIEHVPNPVDLLRAARALLAGDGMLLVVTPDRKSLAARLLGYRWWHYRAAHIGYFDVRTLDLALDQAGLARQSRFRPTWYFPLSYLVERVAQYFPRSMRPTCPSFASGWLAPLNLFDSVAIICGKK